MYVPMAVALTASAPPSLVMVTVPVEPTAGQIHRDVESIRTRRYHSERGRWLGATIVARHHVIPFRCITILTAIEGIGFRGQQKGEVIVRACDKLIGKLTGKVSRCCRELVQAIVHPHKIAPKVLPLRNRIPTGRPSPW